MRTVVIKQKSPQKNIHFRLRAVTIFQRVSSAFQSSRVGQIPKVALVPHGQTHFGQEKGVAHCFLSDEFAEFCQFEAVLEIEELQKQGGRLLAFDHFGESCLGLKVGSFAFGYRGYKEGDI